MEGAFSSLRKMLFRLHLSQQNARKKVLDPSNALTHKKSVSLNLLYDIEDQFCTLYFCLILFSLPLLTVDSNAPYYFPPTGAK